MIKTLISREQFFDKEGNLLDKKPEHPMEVVMRKKISDVCNKFENLIQMAKQSEPGIEFLFSSLSNIQDPLQKIVPTTTITKQDEYEAFIGTKIQMKMKYIRQMISSRRGGAKE